MAPRCSTAAARLHQGHKVAAPGRGCNLWAKAALGLEQLRQVGLDAVQGGLVDQDHAPTWQTGLRPCHLSDVARILSRPRDTIDLQLREP